ncbi:MAG: hypothetical protein ACOZNI_31885 [Myxococcota bacterium]
MRRSLATLALVALACWPMRDAVLAGTVAGAGPDVASTLWAMWWFAEEWRGPAWGAKTVLVNFPDGAHGSVLSPITAAIWTALRSPLGEAAAATWTSAIYLGAFAASVAWLARETGLGRVAALGAGALVLAQRYPVYAPGETSIVGITALTVSVGLVATLKVARGAGWGWTAALAACVGLTGIEMPYLVPVLPVAVAFAAVKGRRGPLLAGLVAGGVLLAALGALHGASQSAEFGLMTQPQRVGFGKWRWIAVEAPWARSTVTHLLTPGPVTWSLDAKASEAAQGRDYLGLSLVGLAGVALVARPRTWPWVGLAVGGVVLATGSDWFGLPGPFALLNAVCMRIVRGLTQPTRYLMLPAIGLSVAAAHGVEALWERRRALGIAAAAALAVDAFAFGGLSLRLPAMRLPMPDCAVALRGQEPDAGVLVWPWDGSRSPEGTVRRRLLQIAHGHPGALFGVGSWKMLGETPMGKRLEDLGWRDATDLRRPMDPAPLHALGYRWVVADAFAGDALMDMARRSFGEPVATCEGATVHRIAPRRSATSGP